MCRSSILLVAPSGVLHGDQAKTDCLTDNCHLFSDALTVLNQTRQINYCVMGERNHLTKRRPVIKLRKTLMMERRHHDVIA